MSASISHGTTFCLLVGLNRQCASSILILQALTTGLGSTSVTADQVRVCSGLTSSHQFSW